MSADRTPPLVLPARDPRGHKGTFGTVCVLGGCAERGVRMIGAPALVATAALRAGAGLAKLLVPEPIMNAALAAAPWATGAPIGVDHEGELLGHEAAAAIDGRLRDGCACLVVGPGMGTSEGARAASIRAVQQDAAPVVVDADALNCLAEVPELQRDFRAAAVLTPHPGEFRRLASALRIAQDPAREETRPAAAEALAQRLGCVVVLKGRATVVSDGHRTWVNATGCDALATAGTGDVLSGVIAGIAAQFVGIAPHPKVPRPQGKPLDLFDAARIAVWAHGRAADRWVARHGASAGMLATELCEEIPGALEEARRAGASG